MGIEAAGFISELVPTNPTGSDDYATADDHLRLVKTVLQAQFPNFIAAAVLASVAELNTLDGYTGDVADFNILAGADAAGLTATELLFLNGVTSGIQAQIDGKAPSAHAHTGTEISDLDTADITTGVFANALISAGNVTQHEAAINHDALLGFVGNEHLRWDLDLGSTNLHANNSINGALALSSGEVSQLANIGGTSISAADWTAVAALVGTNTGDEPAANTSTQGIVERATQAEVDAGADTTRYASIATLYEASFRVKTITGTSDTLAAGDMNRYLEYTNASAIAVTLNTGIGKQGNWIVIYQDGTGQVTVSGSATFRQANGLKTAKRRSVIVLYCIATNEWVVAGDAAA